MLCVNRSPCFSAGPRRRGAGSAGARRHGCGGQPSRSRAASARSTPPTACRCRNQKHGIDEWSWFPTAEKDGEFVFGKSTEPLSPFRKQLSFLGGLYHPSGPKADPHVCSDMWLTGAPLHNPKPRHVQLGRPRPGRRAAHQAVLPAAVAGAVDRRRHRVPLAHRHDLLQPRRPADPRGEQSAPRLRPPVPRRPRRR